jgi:hypothetical protein
MSKSIITRLFLGSVVAVVAALVLGFIAVIMALAGGAFVMEGPDVVDIRATPFAFAMVALALVAVLVLVAAGIAGLVAWIGALINTAQLNEMAWFVVLLALGVWNLGFIAMLLYVIAGPDDTRVRAGRAVTAAS